MTSRSGTTANRPTPPCENVGSDLLAAIAAEVTGENTAASIEAKDPCLVATSHRVGSICVRSPPVNARKQLVVSVDGFRPDGCVAIRQHVSELGAGKLSFNQSRHFLRREWWWPGDGSVVLPVTTTQLRTSLQGQSCDRPNAVAHARRTGEPDDHKHATRIEQIAHTSNPSFSINMMEHRDRRNHIERGGLQRDGEEITDHETGLVARTVVRSSTLDARCIRVQSRYL